MSLQTPHCSHGEAQVAWATWQVITRQDSTLMAKKAKIRAKAKMLDFILLLLNSITDLEKMIWKVAGPLGFILKYSQVQNWFALETMLVDHKKYKKDAFFSGRVDENLRGAQIIQN